MKKYKIISVVGARPNFIKAAPINRALEKAGSFENIILHTGQHYDHDLSESFFCELAIPAPKYNLAIGSGRQAWQLGQMITGIDSILEIEKPDLVIVVGDTNSTAAGAIAAGKNFVPVAHVEAGLREFKKDIPEEINKLLTTAVTDLYFCPTPTGVSNLRSIGKTRGVYLTGDVGIDLVLQKYDEIEKNEQVLLRFGLEAGKYYLFTCHRAANTSDKANLKSILEAVAELNLPVIWPIHPRTTQAIKAFHLPDPGNYSHVIPTPPLGFTDLQTLIQKAHIVITDSGGIIKEAYFHKTPGIIIDRQTEWIETVEEGWNSIAGPDRAKILAMVMNYSIPPTHNNVLGNGQASQQIVQIISEYLKNHVSHS